MSELQAADIAEARRGFRRRLRRKGFSWHFIDSQGEDLFGQAQLELIQALAKGKHVYHPPSWLIHCAWNRTIDLLDKQARRPKEVTVEKLATLESEEAGPEEALLAAERHDRLLQAMQYLLPAQREIIELIYLKGDDMPRGLFRFGVEQLQGRSLPPHGLGATTSIFRRRPPAGLTGQGGVWALELCAGGSPQLGHGDRSRGLNPAETPGIQGQLA